MFRHQIQVLLGDNVVSDDEDIGNSKKIDSEWSQYTNTTANQTKATKTCEYICNKYHNALKMRSTKSLIANGL